MQTAILSFGRSQNEIFALREVISMENSKKIRTKKKFVAPKYTFAMACRCAKKKGTKKG